MQPRCTPFSILNQSFVLSLVLTVFSWFAYRFLRRQVRWFGIPIFLRIFHSLLWYIQSKRRGRGHPTPVFLPGNFHGWRSLLCCSPWGCKESDMTEQLNWTELKAFDFVDHDKLWKILKEMEIPNHLTCLLRNLFTGQEAIVITRHRTTDWLKIGKGVCQGWILWPCLFNLYAEYIMRMMKRKLESRLPGEISTTSDMQIPH